MPPYPLRLSRPNPTSMEDDANARIQELEARLIAHGIVLQMIVRLLSEQTIAELKAAAQSIDDEGMHEANPDPHMRRVAEELLSLLEMTG